MAIRDLKTLLAIADSGSFAAAARAVHRTQSAVSAQMKSLEEELGVDLFDRSKRPPVLNGIGHAFVGRTREVIHSYEALFEDVRSPAVEGHLRLGVVPSVITGVMPQALVALRTKYPRLHIELAMGLSADLVERVRRGKLDAAIASDLKGKISGLRWRPFAREPLVVIAPIDAPERTAEEFVTTFPFIRYTRQAWVGELIEGLLRRRQLRVNELMTLDTLEAITTMVHHGLGVSIVPLREGSDPFALPLRKVSFSGSAVYRVIGVAEPPRHDKSNLAEMLLHELRVPSGLGAHTLLRTGIGEEKRKSGAKSARGLLKKNRT